MSIIYFLIKMKDKIYQSSFEYAKPSELSS